MSHVKIRKIILKRIGQKMLFSQLRPAYNAFDKRVVRDWQSTGAKGIIVLIILFICAQCKCPNSQNLKGE